MTDPDSGFYGEFLRHAVDSALAGICEAVLSRGGTLTDLQKGHMRETIGDMLTQFQEINLEMTRNPIESGQAAGSRKD